MGIKLFQLTYHFQKNYYKTFKSFYEAFNLNKFPIKFYEEWNQYNY